VFEEIELQKIEEKNLCGGDFVLTPLKLGLKTDCAILKCI